MNAGMLWFDNDPKTALTAKMKAEAEALARQKGMMISGQDEIERLARIVRRT